MGMEIFQNDGKRSELAAQNTRKRHQLVDARLFGFVCARFPCAHASNEKGKYSKPISIIHRKYGMKENQDTNSTIRKIEYLRQSQICITK